MIINSVIMNGEKVDMELIIGNEFAEAFKKYNFKDAKELNELYQAQSRCTEKGLYSWCPADTKWLKRD